MAYKLVANEAVSTTDEDCHFLASPVSTAPTGRLFQLSFSSLSRDTVTTMPRKAGIPTASSLMMVRRCTAELPMRAQTSARYGSYLG